MKNKKRLVARMMACVLAIGMVFTVGCKKKEKITGSSVIAQINGQDITVEEASFYIYLQQANYEAYYLSQNTEIVWSKEYEDEDGNMVSIGDTVKKESMEIIYKQMLFLEKAKEWNITLDDEDKKEIDERITEFLTESDADLLKKVGSNEELVRKMYESVELYSKVCEHILKDSPVTVTDEEAHQVLVTIAIIDSELFDYPDEVAEAILERVKGGEDIKYVADKYDVETSTGNVGKGDMGNKLEEVSLSLKKGESGIAEVDGYYYVIYCDDDDDTEATKIAKEAIQKEKEAEVIDKYYQDLKSKATIKVIDKVYNSIKLDEHILTMEDMEKATTAGDNETTAESGTTAEGETTAADEKETATEK